MKVTTASRLLLAASLALALPLLAKEETAPSSPVKEEKAPTAAEFDPILFARQLGHLRGTQLRANLGPGTPLEIARLPQDVIVEGFRSGLEGAAAPLGEEASQRMAVAMDLHVKVVKAKEAAEAEKKAAVIFAENAKRKEVRTLPSGIQYEILREGEGPLADPRGGLQIRYVTRLLDGTEVESNLSAPEPSFVTLDQFIPGSQIVALSMPAGAKWRCWIPARLAYGAEGNFPRIGPGQALCIEQEIVAVFPSGDQPKAPAASPPPAVSPKP